MPSRRDRSQLPIEEIEIRLKPFLGIEPRVYVPVLWALALLAIVFLVLFLPGIRANGTWMTIETLPADAAVYVDGVRAGAGGDAVFIRRGNRVLEVRRPGFRTSRDTLDVPGRIFASKLFPRTGNHSVRLTADPGQELARDAIRLFGEWTATGAERDRYAVPPVLTQAARDLLAADSDRPPSSGVLLPLCVDERHLADVLRYSSLLASQGAPVGMESLVSLVDLAASSATGRPESLRGVLEILDDQSLEAWNLADIRSEENTRNSALGDAARTAYDVAGQDIEPVRRLYGGLPFVTVPLTEAVVGDIEVVEAGYRPRNGAAPVAVRVGRYAVAAREITNDDFALFVEDIAAWSPANRTKLMADGMADEGYLEGWTSAGPAPGSGNLPVTGVSWYAAEAYAEWFDARFGSTNLRFRLPREDEWEIAGRLNGAPQRLDGTEAGLRAASAAESGRIGLRGMVGNVREWCDGPYRYNENRFRTLDGSFADVTPESAEAVPERPVRGGAHIDRDLPYPVAARGGLSPGDTSPVVGFRLVQVVGE